MPRRPWTEEDEQFLLDNYVSMTAKSIAVALNRSRLAVQQRIAKLRESGAIAPKGRPFPDWTKTEDAAIIARYAELGVARMAQELGRTESAVKARAHFLRTKNRDVPYAPHPPAAPARYLDFAYLAGIFDAGVSYQIRKREGNYAVRLTVSVPSLVIAEMFQDALGGKLELTQAKNQHTGKLAWYARDAIHTLLVRLQPYAQHPKFNAMLDFLEEPSDDTMRAVMEFVDPWAA